MIMRRNSIIRWLPPGLREAARDVKLACLSKKEVRNVPEYICPEHSAARHDPDRRVPQPIEQRRRPGDPALAGRAVPVVQHRAAPAAVPLPGMGPPRRTADRAAAWR